MPVSAEYPRLGTAAPSHPRGISTSWGRGAAATRLLSDDVSLRNIHVLGSRRRPAPAEYPPLGAAAPPRRASLKTFHGMQVRGEARPLEARPARRAVPRVSVLHGLKDDHSTIVEHKPFWRILLGAEEGDGIENRTPHFKTWVCMANHDNSRNSIVADFPPECQLLRRALWDHMVLPGDRRLAYRDLPSNAWD